MSDTTNAPGATGEVLRLIEAAEREVSALCSGTRRWTMCVPVQQTDSDITISNALRAAKDALLTTAPPAPLHARGDEAVCTCDANIAGVRAESPLPDRAEWDCPRCGRIEGRPNSARGEMVFAKAVA